MRWLRRLFGRPSFSDGLREQWGFKSDQRTGEGFEQWLDRETRDWVRGG